MEFSKTDANQIQNVIKILNRASLQMTGAQEVMAFAESYRWLTKLATAITEQIEHRESMPPLEKAEPELKPRSRNQGRNPAV